jgi:phenylpropionate dioxygenase-like ring-hydroxylating dioxygenase large terminal subunit
MRVPIPREKQVTQWPKYDELEGGLIDYWYPVMTSGRLQKKIVPMQLFGKNVIFVRDHARIFALADRCPHRGTPLRFGKRDFPGTLTCVYHGWCFDLESGKLAAALTEGPDSPMVGKASVQTYPVREHFGLIWIYMGSGTPPPLGDDMPAEFSDSDMVHCIRITEQEGNWRFAVENHFDEAHANYLHRPALFSFFACLPAYKQGLRITRNGPWLQREQDAVQYAAHYPGLGRWPKSRFWKLKYAILITVRMPGIGRVSRRAFTAYKFHVPVNNERFLFVQVLVKKATGFGALLFRAHYWLSRRWLYHVLFNNDDVLMTRHSHSGAEQLFGPDVSITAWRKMCIEEARVSSIGPVLSTMQADVNAEAAHS